MDRHAEAPASLHEPIRKRWSPRAFADREVTREQLLTLLEAARWAPSCFNEQPWRFVVALRSETEAHARILSCLVPANQAWAKTSPVLMLSLASTVFAKNGKKNAHAWHDVGLAAASMTIQAMTLGLYVHQMAGIDAARVRALFELPDEVEPVAGIAIGHLGDPSTLPKDLAEKEVGPRIRRNLAESVFRDRFGSASPLVG